MNYIKIIILLSIFTFISCGNDKDDTEIDDELKATLIQASNGEGLDIYKLPKATQLEKIPQDPKNILTTAKIELGKNLFHETSFATGGEFPITIGTYSCATCHHAEAGFQAGVAQGLGEGGEGFGIYGEERNRNLLCEASKCDVQPLRTPTTLNGAYQPLMLWNGQFGSTSLNEGTEELWPEDTPIAINFLGYEGLEVQAIAGLKVHRMEFNEASVTQHGYKAMFDEIFSDFTSEDRYSLETAGLAIAAYERSLLPYKAPFQKYLHGNREAMTTEMKEGANLFFGKAQCGTCHTGPALNKMEFHALGMNEFKQDQVTHYDPLSPAQNGRYSFTKDEDDRFKFKTPQLYNLKKIDFLGHGASFSSIQDVVAYKNKGVAENANVSKSQLASGFHALGLTEVEMMKISTFIADGLFDADIKRYVPTSLPSGNCFPNADTQSKIDLGCE